MKVNALFIDRDGVINEKRPEGDYVKEWKEFKFLPGVFEALKILKDNNYLIIIITNQRGIARGLTTEVALKNIHNRMLEMIRENGANVDAIYLCPHEIAEECNCRKPKPGMIYNAINDFKRRGIEINLATSYLVGDSESDVLAGNTAGLRTIKLGDHSPIADFTKADLLDCARSITDR